MDRIRVRMLEKKGQHNAGSTPNLPRDLALAWIEIGKAERLDQAGPSEVQWIEPSELKVTDKKKVSRSRSSTKS